MEMKSWIGITSNFLKKYLPLLNLDHLIEEAQIIYEKDGCPKGLTVFQEIKSDGTLFLYFSPVARGHCLPLFNSYVGITCDEPARSDKPIIWIAGDSTPYFLWQ